MEMLRYKKQVMLPEFGIAGQEKLKKARVLVVGCGGLGCSVLPLLCAAGVGYIRLYDHDRIEESNLHRQYVYCMDDLGKEKALVMRDFLRRQNPGCMIEACVKRLVPSLLSEAVQGIDVIVDAADSFVVTYLLSDYCHQYGIPFISASVVEYHGYVGAFCGGMPSYRAVFPRPVASNVNCNTSGVMGPLVAMLGSMQAQMVLNILLQLSRPTLGHLFSVDCFSWKISQFCFQKAEEPDADLIIPFLDKTTLKEDDYLVELRDEVETPVSIRSEAIRLLPEKVDQACFPENRRIVFICKTGVRAIKAAYSLQKKGFRRLGIYVDSA